MAYPLFVCDKTKQGIISSVFGKRYNNVVDWINKGLATYINKEKALDYLHHSAPIAEALSNPKLYSAAKVVEKSETSKGEAGKDEGKSLTDGTTKSKPNENVKEKNLP